MKDKKLIGASLKTFRLDRGLTLSNLAEKTNLAASTISKIENGISSITVNNIKLITEALEIPLATVFGSENTQESSGRRAITRKGNGTIVSTKNNSFEMLCDDIMDKRNVFWHVEVKARSLDDYDVMSTHPGEEFIYVIRGTVEVHTTTYKSTILNQGDSIFFDSTMEHAYVAISEETPILLMTNTLSKDISEF